jgi:hypothetical protein
MSDISEISNIKSNNICKICKTTDVPYSPRYPNLVCWTCVKSAVDIDGNKVEYLNIDASGGFKSIHHVKNKLGEIESIEKNDHYCWINGIKCSAQEARFGGIVLQIIVAK